MLLVQILINDLKKTLRTEKQHFHYTALLLSRVILTFFSPQWELKANHFDFITNKYKRCPIAALTWTGGRGFTPTKVSFARRKRDELYRSVVPFLDICYDLKKKKKDKYLDLVYCPSMRFLHVIKLGGMRLRSLVPRAKLIQIACFANLQKQKQE